MFYSQYLSRNGNNTDHEVVPVVEHNYLVTDKSCLSTILDWLESEIDSKA